ncbi:MAG: S8 family serine peptidase [Phycisphaeraceae bacterium]|nr:S8 family serine peptidase [Phycisphaeraceae bacterium]
MQRLRFMVLGLTAAAGTTMGLAQAVTEERPQEPMFVERPGAMEFSGTMIARPRQNLSAAERNAALDLLAPRLMRQYIEVDEYIIEVPVQPEGTLAGAGENALAAELLATGLFQYVEPNWIVYPTTTPDDPRYGEQWHHAVVRSPQAWTVTTGAANIVTAFTDTGIDLNHPDLAPNRIPGYNAVVERTEAAGGQVNDLNGHGTHVAGIGAAIGNNGIGVAGIAWNTRIMMIRVSDSSGGGSSIEILTRGARWAAENGAHVVSTSYTGVQNNAISTTGDYIRGLGVLYLYAADNSNTNHSGFDWPNVIIVGATDRFDNKASFSSFGRAVDLFAPGVDILSTCNGQSYCQMSGTSMATPLVNGVIGMMLSANPALSADLVEQLLFESCVDLGIPGNDDYWGWGRVDLFEAVQRAAALSGPMPPYAIDDNAGIRIAGQTITLDVLANDYDLNPGDSIFLDTFDAVSANGGVISRSVGTGPGGRDQLLYTAPATTGPDTFSYSIRDTTDLTDSAQVTIQVVDDTFFRNPDAGPGGEPGLLTAYYEVVATQLPDFTTLTPYLEEVQPALHFPQTAGVFAGSGRTDFVGAVFNGYIDIPEHNMYTIYLNSDDGSRLFLGDDMLINNDFTHSMLERSAQVPLKAGRHRIRVEYFERTLFCGLIVSLSSPSMPKAPVPSSMWSHGGDDACPADFSGSSDPNHPAYGVPDGVIDGADFFFYLDQFVSGNLAIADLTGSSDPNDPAYGVPDGIIDAADFFYFLDLFILGCP